MQNGHGREQGAVLATATELALELMGRLNALPLTSPAPTEGINLLASGQVEVMQRFAELERRTQSAVYNMQPRLSFDPEDVAHELHDRSAARGVTLTLIVPPRDLQFHPLLTSFTPVVLLGPVHMNCILIDDRIAILPGMSTREGEPTAWIATGGDYLEQARALMKATIAESTPALADGQERPLNRRQLDVARAVCLGKTDSAIARQLGISPRTVARDLTVIFEVTGARSRGEAILNMLGRGRHSRP